MALSIVSISRLSSIFPVFVYSSFWPSFLSAAVCQTCVDMISKTVSLDLIILPIFWMMPQQILLVIFVFLLVVSSCFKNIKTYWLPDIWNMLLTGGCNGAQLIYQYITLTSLFFCWHWNMLKIVFVFLRYLYSLFGFSLQSFLKNPCIYVLCILE